MPAAAVGMLFGTIPVVALRRWRALGSARWGVTFRRPLLYRALARFSLHLLRPHLLSLLRAHLLHLSLTLRLLLPGTLFALGTRLLLRLLFALPRLHLRRALLLGLLWARPLLLGRSVSLPVLCGADLLLCLYLSLLLLLLLLGSSTRLRPDVSRSGLSLGMPA